jgi:hypothetical protein
MPICYASMHTANDSHALVVQGSFALSADTSIEKKPHNVVALKDGSSCMVSTNTTLKITLYLRLFVHKQVMTYAFSSMLTLAGCSDTLYSIVITNAAAYASQGTASTAAAVAAAAGTFSCQL